ncbi:MAG TPA: DASS family sodium-coupled anion symporter [Pyrinomonadaceae bacterium]|jgi:DASS family divalent anion:Na+ symporter|nr:DASS family sodium-coupled anion symporter [Pyrinomonadaceae bacterium]
MTTTETVERPEADTTPDQIGWKNRLVRWAVVLLVAGGILLIPRPEGVEPASWRLLAIFAATITGSIVQPIPGAAIVLLGVTALALFKVLSIGDALAGYADPVVWLVLAAFFISRGMIKTGLGRRIAFLFIKAIGRHSLGLSYALASTETVLATVIPSTGARSGGIIFPITKSLAEAYESRPGPTARRLGAFLMTSVYQCNVIVCAMFLTGQASNPIIARFAKQTTGIEITYARWALGSIVPALLSLLVVPWLLYRVFPPEIKHTPAASEFASKELKLMGPMKWSERLMLMVFGLVAILWITTKLHQIDYAVVAMLGISVLLVTGVLDWEDLISEKAAWAVFIWYGGLIRMAEALGQTGLTKRFAEAAASLTTGWKWWLALASLLLIYFYAHYVFASITAHATAMYVPFLIVILAAGAPAYLAVLSLAYFSNLGASLTHYGTTPAPIYFGAGYTTQRTWWTLGLITSVVTILIWSVVGFAWWKILGLW